MLEVEKKYYVKPVGSNAFRTVLIFLQWPIKKKKNRSKQSLALTPYYNAYA